jgi:hypothetical protein
MLTNYRNNESTIAFFRYHLYSDFRIRCCLIYRGLAGFMAKALYRRHREKNTLPSSLKDMEIHPRESTSLTPLNFKVSTEFHREFKTYAAQRGVSMLELLQEGFRLVKERQGE